VETPVRVAIVAEHASARFGGEAILPFHYFLRLRQRGVEAWLVVHERTRPELEERLGPHHDRVLYSPDLPIHQRLNAFAERLPHRIAANTVGLVIQAITETDQRRTVERLVKEQGVNVVHEPIPVSPKAPSYIADVGAPVIVGPMNGGMGFPSGFEHLQSVAERQFVRVGRGMASAVHYAIPGKRKAALLLVANARTRDALPASVRHVPTLELVENGVDTQLFTVRQLRSETPVRFAYVGRLVAWKAVDLLLEALAHARDRVDVRLELFGDGEERSRLQALTQDKGLVEAVTFHGFVPQSELPARLADTDALVLPSLYECGGAVVLEAMAMGMPVLATDWGGPADYVTTETGVLVDPSGGPESFVTRLCEGLVRMAQDPEQRAAMGRAGHLQAVEVFEWERKIDRMMEIYRAVIEGRARELAHETRPVSH
jgi:glycosyltransferase involved in cell wall biosynthesis